MSKYVLFKTEEQLIREFECEKHNDGLHIHGFQCIITRNMLKKYFKGDAIYYKSKKLYRDDYYGDKYTKYLMELYSNNRFYMYDEWVESYIPIVYVDIFKLFKETL